MTPAQPDREVLGRRLRMLTDTLDDLSLLRNVRASQLEQEPLTRAATERLLQVVVDLAVDINAHLAASLVGRAPATGRESFVLVADAGVLEQGLADRLAPAAGLRNVLVHRYTEIRTELVARAVDEVLDGFAAYVHAVAAFLESDPGNRSD